MPFISGNQRLRPLLLLPPEEVLPEDLPPEDLVELLLVVLLPLLDLDGLLDFDELLDLLSLFTPLLRDELLLGLLLFESLFRESFVDLADVPELLVVRFLTVEEGLLRRLPELPAFVSLSDRRERTRFSSSEPAFFRPGLRRSVDLVDLRS